MIIHKKHKKLPRIFLFLPVFLLLLVFSIWTVTSQQAPVVRDLSCEPNYVMFSFNFSGHSWTYTKDWSGSVELVRDSYSGGEWFINNKIVYDLLYPLPSVYDNVIAHNGPNRIAINENGNVVLYIEGERCFEIEADPLYFSLPLG